MFSDSANTLFKLDVNSWKFCFEIICTNGSIIRLTDASRAIKYENLEFLNLSSLALKNAIFDESGSGEIVLNGYFEEEGISSETEIVDAKFLIYLYFQEEKSLEKFVEYYCHEIIKNEISFDLKLYSITKKYESNLLQFYSTSCRAQFGDERCSVDPSGFDGKGCDKSFRMCCNKYNNAVNFRGEPFIPYAGYFNGSY